MKKLLWCFVGMMASYVAAADHCGKRIPKRYIRSSLPVTSLHNRGTAGLSLKLGKNKPVLCNGTSIDNTLTTYMLRGSHWLKDFSKLYYIGVDQEKSGEIVLSSVKKK